MKNVLKISIVVFASLILCACGNKEESKGNVGSNSNNDSAREVLVDKSVVPKKLNFDFNVEGTKKLNLYVIDETKNNLEVPVVDSSYLGKVFDDFSISVSRYLGGMYNKFEWYINDSNGNKFSVVGYMYGLTGAFKEKGASEVVDGYKPDYILGDGGESSFFKERYDSTFNSFIRENTYIRDGAGNNSGEIILLDSSTMINDTYSLSTMSFRYGTTPLKYSKSSLQGYRKVVKFEQQLTDYMRLELTIIQEHSEKARENYDVATAMSVLQVEEIKNNEHLNEVFESILKMYDCFNQYEETLKNGKDFSELFEENRNR